MSQIIRIRNELTWSNGGPGVNTFHVSAGVPSPLDWEETADQALTELQQGFETIVSCLVVGLNWRLSPDIDVLDVETGNIVDQISIQGAPRTGTGSDESNGAVRAQQAYLRFRTNEFVGGTRLAGGVYLGPVGGTQMDTTGAWKIPWLGVLEDAFEGLISNVGPRLAVYHRPAKGAVSGGYYGDVTSIRAKKNPGLLRSRRD